MGSTAEAVVIGGGVMGCSILYNLAARGLTNAVLLERDLLGSGSTGRSSGVVRMHYSNEVHAHMAWQSLKVFQNFDQLIGGDCGLTQTGFLIFTADESILYIADSGKRHVLAYPVNPDLSLGEPSVFIDMDVTQTGNPDGIKVDVENNVYIAGGGGIWAVDPSGRHLGTLEFPELPANLAFGGPRNMTLFVTARTGIYSIRVNVPGRPLFQP